MFLISDFFFLIIITYIYIFFRCPDPRKPNDVLYDVETDRLVPFNDTYESIDTDYGPISISGMI